MTIWGYAKEDSLSKQTEDLRKAERTRTPRALSARPRTACSPAEPLGEGRTPHARRSLRLAVFHCRHRALLASERKSREIQTDAKVHYQYHFALLIMSKGGENVSD